MGGWGRDKKNKSMSKCWVHMSPAGFVCARASECVRIRASVMCACIYACVMCAPALPPIQIHGWIIGSPGSQQGGCLVPLSICPGAQLTGNPRRPFILPVKLTDSSVLQNLFIYIYIYIAFYIEGDTLWLWVCVVCVSQKGGVVCECRREGFTSLWAVNVNAVRQ